MSKPLDPFIYHATAPAGKISVQATKPLDSVQDLAVAYSPGVARVSQAIATAPETVYDYTAKGNLVGVITNGTAVLGLGAIGAAAAKPVMEGKAVLFKKLAGIDAFDIELAEKDPKEVIKIIKALEPTFGAINLEDIKAPECFDIEAALEKALTIPVMHDDQHGTAIIVAAALENALLLAKKQLQEVKVVINGAGAGAIACAHLLINRGLSPSQLILVDSKGVVHQDRSDLNPHKAYFATKESKYTLEAALKGADVFIGLSVANVLLPSYLEKDGDRSYCFCFG